MERMACQASHASKRTPPAVAERRPQLARQLREQRRLRTWSNVNVLKVVLRLSRRSARNVQVVVVQLARLNLRPHRAEAAAVPGNRLGLLPRAGIQVCA